MIFDPEQVIVGVSSGLGTVVALWKVISWRVGKQEERTDDRLQRIEKSILGKENHELICRAVRAEMKEYFGHQFQELKDDILSAIKKNGSGR